jgi:hypothetical protein
MLLKAGIKVKSDVDILKINKISIDLGINW